jgi:hypothetical protein
VPVSETDGLSSALASPSTAPFFIPPDTDTSSASSRLPNSKVIPFLVGRMEKSGEKFFLDEGKSCGKAVRLVNSADFSLDPGRFTEIRQKLIRSEEFKQGRTLCRAHFPAGHCQEPASNEQGKHSVANPCLFAKLFDLVHGRS